MACKNCFTGGTATGTPTGETTTIHGYKTYIALPPSSTPSSTSTIIIYTDAFGLLLPNNLLLADFYAASTGCRVLVPDIIPGGALSPDAILMMDASTATVPLLDIRGQFWRAWCLAQTIGYMVPFFWRAKPDHPVCLERCVAYARAVRAGMKADTKGGKLGVAGFCWGGYQNTNMCSYASVEGGDERLVDAHFCAHPSLLNVPGDFVNAVKTWKTPISLAHGTKDIALSNKAVDRTEEVLKKEVGDGTGENGYHWEFRRYEGCGHGFAVRAQPDNELEGKGAEGAREQAVEWFNRFL